MDCIADLLEGVHLRSAVLYRGCWTAPWGAQFAPQNYGADACFHFVTEGRCTLTVNSRSVILNRGDFTVLPHGPVHAIHDIACTPTPPFERLNLVPDETGTVHHGGGGEQTTMICGKFFFENRDTNPLFRALPPVLLVRGEQGEAVPWLAPTLAFIACETESERPGAQTVISRLADILFIQAVRVHLAELRDASAAGDGLLRALCDEEIGPVLQAVHRAPSEGWTVAGMAQTAGMSRSAFAARFTGLIGEPPLHYVGRFRCHVAANLLRENRLTTGEVARRVGYESEAAFCKAFKRWTGTGPGTFRRFRQ